jgi:hypothetical protein
VCNVAWRYFVGSADAQVVRVSRARKGLPHKKTLTNSTRVVP